MVSRMSEGDIALSMLTCAEWQVAVWNMALAVRQNTADIRNIVKTEVSSQVVVLYARIYSPRNVARIQRKSTAPAK